MSLTESARGFVKGLVDQEPEVGELESSTRGHRKAGTSPDVTAETSRMSQEAGADIDDVARLRLEWETQPGHH